MNTKIENAISQLKSRANHIADSPVDASIIREHHESIKEDLALYESMGVKEKPFENTGTYESQSFSAAFTYLTAVNVSPKVFGDTERPLPVFVYHYSPIDKKPYYCELVDFYMCFGSSDNYIGSIAKILISASRTEEYPESTELGTVCICSMNNISAQQHRIGTVLIQIAIEHSLRSGFCGRVILNSLADEFYLKLGFVASKPGEEKWLNTPMHLPQEAINEWINKIAQSPLILSPEEVQQYSSSRRIIHALPSERKTQLTFFRPRDAVLPERTNIIQANNSFSGYTSGFLLLSMSALVLLLLLSMQSVSNITEQSFRSPGC